MNGYQFKVTMTLENATGSEQVTHIPRGWIVEPEASALSVQSAIIARDYVFTLNPGEKRMVTLEAECWNRQLAPPRGISGRPTAFKGDIKETTDVWSISASPVADTVLRSPSMGTGVFASLANADPEKALEFLAYQLARPENARRFASLEHELQTLKRQGTHIIRNELVAMSKLDNLSALISATSIREFLIRTGGPSDQHMKLLVDVVTDLFAVHPHDAIKPMYSMALELRDLRQKIGFQVDPKRGEELRTIANSKFLSILDTVPKLETHAE
jgi:hypothetical protein